MPNKTNRQVTISSEEYTKLLLDRQNLHKTICDLYRLKNKPSLSNTAKRYLHKLKVFVRKPYFRLKEILDRRKELSCGVSAKVEPLLDRLRISELCTRIEIEIDNIRFVVRVTEDGKPRHFECINYANTIKSLYEFGVPVKNLVRMKMIIDAKQITSVTYDCEITDLKADGYLDVFSKADFYETVVDSVDEIGV